LLEHGIQRLQGLKVFHLLSLVLGATVGIEPTTCGLQIRCSTN
jgi:hypothetical protein